MLHTRSPLRAGWYLAPIGGEKRALVVSLLNTGTEPLDLTEIVLNEHDQGGWWYQGLAAPKVLRLAPGNVVVLQIADFAPRRDVLERTFSCRLPVSLVASEQHMGRILAEGLQALPSALPSEMPTNCDAKTWP